MLTRILGCRTDMTGFVASEMRVAAVVNSALTVLAAWLTFSDSDPVPVWGLSGVAFDLIPSTFMPVLAMSLLTPVILHLRRTKESIPACDRDELGTWSRWLPRQLFARSFLLSCLWLVAFVPFGAVLLWSSGWTSVSLTSVLVVKALWGMAVGATVCPVIVLSSISTR